ncbi:MAG: 23S rRNA (guanosine(2251)-2'-O)-methyltransferase RlmB [Oscillospiraceae bacterium]|jgi:23S rRNA (guanosine2251-2'-O)-methyltransferase|nr:23S rRNA (guanosine(2251)-2'-O)-methyltransferase RlmB [Oscillospiraceae bacterium]
MENVVEGKNAVIEAFRAGVNIDKIFLAKGEIDTTLKHIASKARELGIAVVEADKRKLDSLSETNSHQGVIAVIAQTEYATVDEIVAFAKQKNESPLIVICDEISDPHNLGAIIRTCEASGVHGVIIPKRRSAGLTATVAKASSGAIFHIKIARVTNITATIKDLKDSGIWIYGASPDGEQTLWETDLTGPVAFVIGSEGQGLGRLVSENCDFKVKIPMSGELKSLNASVSTALLLYEAVRQRR